MSFSLNLYLAAAQRAERKALLAQGNATPEQGTRLARPAGRLVWLHISNAEEIAPAKELVRLLGSEREDISFLFTTPDNIADGVRFQDCCEQPCLHQIVPADTPRLVTEFLSHWHPDIAVWVGTMLRPALAAKAHDQNIPLLLVDARNKATLGRRKPWNKGVINAVLKMFSNILVGKGDIGQSLIQQGAKADTVDVCGLLEEGATSLFCDDRDRDDMAAIIDARPVWLAAYTLEDEDALAVAAHKSASRLSHRLLLIIAPDDPQRGDALAQQLTGEGWLVAQRSRNEDPEEHVQILIADTDDEMGLWFRLSPVCFMGHSLAKGALGRSPFEASALGSAILHGPSVGDYQTGYARLDAAGAAREVVDTADLATNVQDLLAPDKAAAMAHAGWEISTSGAEAADRAVTLIIDMLDQAEEV